MHNVSNSGSSASALTNSGTTLELKPSTNERPSMVSDQRECKKVLRDVIPKSIEESYNKSKNMFDICDPSQCQFLQLHKHPEVNKIVRLTYTNAGNAILALGSNGTHLVWFWPRTNLNLDGKANAKVYPQLWQPKSGFKSMINDLTSIKCGNPVSCFALSKQDAYLISTSGGKISLFNIFTFKTLTTAMPPPPMVTSLAFYPEDNNIFAIGLDNSTILIYYVLKDEVLFNLEGHSKRVTALAFSKTWNILISGDVNAQIIVWKTEGWGKLKDRYLQIHGQKVPEVQSETQIQFHPDQTNFLAVHDSHLAIYEATELRCVKQWVPEVPVVISQATFSSNGHSVYAIFVDGTLAIFEASNLQVLCRVHPCAYLSPTSRLSMWPISIAAHPLKPTQFAVGLTDGSIYVFEPRELGGNWIKTQ
ncbi:topless-related protein 1-like [Abrus precatorius]|uniref:Topless-related protein 1-like n=1 Tax=Abrus precatorius TaxID=3816 RepID=A0A8B8JP72_ABRPR|nr:topless-related protein 1-like [Abrus precatorius]